LRYAQPLKADVSQSIKLTLLKLLTGTAKTEDIHCALTANVARLLGKLRRLPVALLAQSSRCPAGLPKSRLVGQSLGYALPATSEGFSRCGALRFSNLTHAPLLLDVSKRILDNLLLVRILKGCDLFWREWSQPQVCKLPLASLVHGIELRELLRRQCSRHTSRLLNLLQICILQIRVDLLRSRLRAAATFRHIPTPSFTHFDRCPAFVQGFELLVAKLLHG
jgi:hypothetical protein